MWSARWDGPYEGPFTLLAKYAWANVASLSELRALLRWKGPQRRSAQSLLTISVEPDSPLPSTTLLSHWAGQWATELASDAAFRFCPQCIRFGYQAAVHQITALARCPVHGCPLQTACPWCGETTCGYTLAEEAFAHPLHCHHCGVPWSGTDKVRQWSETAAFHDECRTRLAPLHDWLRQLRGRRCRDLRITDLSMIEDDPHGDAPTYSISTAWGLRSDRPRSELDRLVAFEAARLLVPWPLDDGLLKGMPGTLRFIEVPCLPWRPAREWGEAEVDHRPDTYEQWRAQQRAIRAIYKAIRRHMQRTYLRGRLRLIHRVARDYKNEGLRVRAADQAVAVAFVWWRIHCESIVGPPVEAPGVPWSPVTLSYFRELFFSGVLDRFVQAVCRRGMDLRLFANMVAGAFYWACAATRMAWNEANGTASDDVLGVDLQQIFTAQWPRVPRYGTCWEVQLRSPWCTWSTDEGGRRQRKVVMLTCEATVASA